MRWTDRAGHSLLTSSVRNPHLRRLGAPTVFDCVCGGRARQTVRAATSVGARAGRAVAWPVCHRASLDARQIRRPGSSGVCALWGSSADPAPTYRARVRRSGWGDALWLVVGIAVVAIMLAMPIPGGYGSGAGRCPSLVQVLNKEPGIPRGPVIIACRRESAVALWGLATVTAGPAIGFAWLASMAFRGSRGGPMGRTQGVEWSRRAGARS